VDDDDDDAVSESTRGSMVIRAVSFIVFYKSHFQGAQLGYKQHVHVAAPSTHHLL
jgi:hypothetical protein